MALNPATVNVSPGVPGAVSPDGQMRAQAAGPGFAPQVRQGPVVDLRTPGQFGGLDADAQGSRNVAVFRRALDDRFSAGGDPQSLSEGSYGDYWDASLPVFSLAVFEAQLYVQERTQGSEPTASHSQGNQLYLDIQDVLERAMAAPTDADHVLEEDEDSGHINVLA